MKATESGQGESKQAVLPTQEQSHAEQSKWALLPETEC